MRISIVGHVKALGFLWYFIDKNILCINVIHCYTPTDGVDAHSSMVSARPKFKTSNTKHWTTIIVQLQLQCCAICTHVYEKVFVVVDIFGIRLLNTTRKMCSQMLHFVCVCVFFWLTIRYTWSDKNIIFGARYENGNAHNEYFVCFMKYSGYNKRARVLELYFWSVFPFVLYI